jgi:hypothetical protein
MMMRLQASVDCAQDLSIHPAVSPQGVGTILSHKAVLTLNRAEEKPLSPTLSPCPWPW